jgi:hypothetical protein
MKNPEKTGDTSSRQQMGIHSILSACALALTLSACGSEDEATAGGSITIQISGEDAATDGFLYPSGSEVTFADGWELHFEHILVSVGAVTISEDPQRSPSDQSQTGAAVARAEGPWAVDLALGGDALGAGGEGEAIPLAVIANQNLNGGEPFEADRNYAFGYDIVTANEAARIVNFGGDAGAESAYETMLERGYAVLYVGTARFRGGDECRTSESDYDFDALPSEVPFELGFATPTTYVNCQNQENQGDPFPGEEFPRGIAPLPNRSALGQITLHLEHPFFSSVVHDSGIYFDQFAARLVGARPGTILTTETLAGVDPTWFRDGAGTPLPWRDCSGSELPAGTRGFDVGTLPLDPEGDPGSSLRDYRDFVSYVQSTQGHLNGGEGLCAIRRNYPSPP